jgi:hypothetical protein
MERERESKEYTKAAQRNAKQRNEAKQIGKQRMAIQRAKLLRATT